MVCFQVQGNHCWICDKEGNITGHHAIPKQLNPKNNIQVPICRKCHDKINSIDISQVASYLYKLKRTTNEQTNAILFLSKIVGEHLKDKTSLNKP